MKKIKLSCKLMLLALAIMILVTLCLPCFEPFQRLSKDGTELILGFPFNFYTVKRTVTDNFAVHFNAAGFLANYAVFYAVIYALNAAYEKIKEKRGSR